MFKSKHLFPIFKCKQISILFIVLFSSVQVLFGQVQLSTDSVSLIHQDSINRVAQIKDSLNFVNLRTDSGVPNYYLDSLKSVVIVSDNNFVSWMDNMNKLRAKDNTFQKVASPIKMKRPVWVLLFILGLFASIGLVRFFFFNIFHNILYGFYNDRALTQINKEDSILTSWPYIFLYIIFSLSLGLFFTIYRGYILHVVNVDFLLFLKTSLLIAILFLLKLIIIKIIGVLFQIEKLVREYIVFLYLFYFNSALVLMPLLIFVAFLPASYFNFLLILFVSILSILFIFRFLKIVLTLMGGLRFPIFYLILYLCTLEIAPVLILVKSLNK